MIVRTETYKDMEKDIATLMDVDEMFLYETMHDISEKCLCGFHSDWDKYESLIDDFITEYADLDIIDEIYVYHLSRHIVQPKELWPLRELLITENEFSDFLKKNKIHFMLREDNLEFYYDNRLISPEQILQSGHFHLLAKRLGYLGEADYCVNGFSFWPNIDKTSEGYFQDLQRGPEILENLGRFIGKDLWRDYKKQSKYYGIVFKVPMLEIIYDGIDGLFTKEERAGFFIKKALFYLNDCYRNCPGGNNLMLRVSDTKKVVVDHCILIKEDDVL